LRKLIVNSILVSRPKPEEEKKDPFFQLQETHKLKVDFRSFTHVDGINVQDFRKERIDILAHTGIILTSREAAKHFFRMCKEMRITVPETMKYFCITESLAYYLQHEIAFRKRKIFHGDKKFSDLIDILKKHKDEKFLFPCADNHKEEMPSLLEELDLKYTKAVLYKTVSSDLSDLKNIFYDILVFYSPHAITSLFENFPDFKQNNTRIAAFGSMTSQAIRDAGLILDIEAPMPNAPSMTMAIESYIKSIRG
jgi:uroporphyrinogen-III synthase